MTRGFLNLNRFKYGKAVKQSSKQKPNLQGASKTKSKAKHRQ